MNRQEARIRSGITRGEEFYIELDGEKVIAYAGETLATIMLASGQRIFRHSLLSREPRGLYCGMGLCFDCLVTVNGRPNVRACVTVAQPGDHIERQI